MDASKRPPALNSLALASLWDAGPFGTTHRCYRCFAPKPQTFMPLVGARDSGPWKPLRDRKN